MFNENRAARVLTGRGSTAVLLATLVVGAPLALYLPLWVTAVFALCGGWRYLVAELRWPLPSPALRMVLVGIGLAGVLIDNGTVLGRDAGVSLLLLMVSLKLLELNTLRDAHVVIVLDYFILLTHFLFTQSILSAAYMAVGILVVTAVLNSLNHETAPQTPGSHLRLAATVGLQALPLMVVLFLLFPRFGGPLWSIAGDGSGTTGLSPDMAPGRISQLSQSDAVAFRVAFDGPVPPQRKLYWRGPVLWHTDGVRWTGGRNSNVATVPGLHYTPRGDAVRYTVTLEPDDQRWLLALDLPATVPKIGYITPDYQLHADKRVTRRVHYSVTSFVNYTTGPLTPDERRRALQLPPRGNPGTRALAQHWRATLHDDGRIVQRALTYFHDMPFVYTMTPPPLHGDQVDDFLFHTRRGFCEHYASSFTWLMRAAGIPARVVTGYQGGELNPLGDYLIVRQNDAHAWSEVWLAGRGWVRVDPTSAVAPQRIELGLGPIAQPDGEPALFQASPPHFLTRLWRAAGLGWDALNYNWDQWVLGYSRQKQIDLLSSMGFEFHSWSAIAAGFIGALAVTFFLVAAAVMHNKHRGRRDRVVRAYLRFCNKLARRGIERAPWEGPAAFARRVARLRPELAAAVQDISRLYMDLRYGGNPPRAGLQAFTRRVRAFHP